MFVVYTLHKDSLIHIFQICVYCIAPFRDAPYSASTKRDSFKKTYKMCQSRRNPAAQKKVDVIIIFILCL